MSGLALVTGDKYEIERFFSADRLILLCLTIFPRFSFALLFFLDFALPYYFSLILLCLTIFPRFSFALLFFLDFALPYYFSSIFLCLTIFPRFCFALIFFLDFPLPYYFSSILLCLNIFPRQSFIYLASQEVIDNGLNNGSRYILRRTFDCD